jgi:hypothetical protein
MKTNKRSLEVYAALGITLLSQTHAAAQVIIRDFNPDLRMMNWGETGLLKGTVTIDISKNDFTKIKTPADFAEKAQIKFILR